MEEELLTHLKGLDLLDIIEDNKKIFRKVLRKCLNATENDKIVIITDKGHKDQRIAPMLSAGYVLAAKELNIDSKVVIQEPVNAGGNASEKTSAELDRLKEENIIIICISGKIGTTKYIGKSFRKFAKEKNHRYISTTGMKEIKTDSYLELIESIDIDYTAMKKKCALIEQELLKAKEIHVTTEKGTDLKIKIKNSTVTVNDGDYTKPGSGGNIPCGEVYLAPLKKKVEGTAVIDLSSKNLHGTDLVAEPIKLIIEEGDVIEIKGESHQARKLRETIDWAMLNSKFTWGVKRIGELGIGVNEKAKLLGSMIVDEKGKDTAHVAIGSNAWFGGTVYSKIHVDQVMKDPTFYLDGKRFDIDSILDPGEDKK